MHHSSCPEVLQVFTKALQLGWSDRDSFATILELVSRHSSCKLSCKLWVWEADERIAQALVAARGYIEEVVHLFVPDFLNSCENVIPPATAWNVLNHERQHVIAVYPFEVGAVLGSLLPAANW
jgi:hypothetical protein